MMAKRLSALVLAAALLFLSACSTAFNKEYLSVTEYTDEEHNEYWHSAVEVSTYAELLAAMNDMVKNHVAEERIHFTDYEGVKYDDLAQARREVEEETALGSYSVEYVSYDQPRIYTYYDATVYINYKRSQTEVAEIAYVAGEQKLRTFLQESLSSLKQYAAVRMNSPDLTEESILFTVNSVFNANPASCVLPPEIEVKLHPDSGQDRIIELSFNYGKTPVTIRNMRQELNQAVLDLTTFISAADAQTFAFEAYNSIAARVYYDPGGDLRKEGNMEPELGSSAYGALVEGVADSYGIALAYSALCREAGIECIVVKGTYDKADHCWNIIKLGESYYHVDVSADSVLGITGAFGCSDDQMLSGYWWNIEAYPECLSPLA
jgi:hypothetical protein